MTVCVIIVIKLHDTNPVIITPSQAYNHQPASDNLVTVYWKNIQNIKFSRHIILTQSAGGTEAIVRSL